jgi:UDP-glucuronate 4-epimerase
MSILVTGGAGFIGSTICEKLLRYGKEVICLDNFNDFYDPAIKEQNIRNILDNSRFTLFRNDILDINKMHEIFKKYNVELVIHLAARAGVRPSINNAGLYSEVNLNGTINLLDCCKNFGVNRFIFASSSSVYGGNKKIPFSETDNVDRPVSPYAATKKAGELICHTYNHLFDISIFCYRFFTVYGPRQRPEMAIYKFTESLFTGRTIEIYGDGRASRDYTYIDDITDVILNNLEAIDGFEIFNLGNSRPVDLLELIRLLEDITGKNAKIKFSDLMPGDVEITCADILKAEKMLEYNPKITIEEGLQRFVKWYKKTRLI